MADPDQGVGDEAGFDTDWGGVEEDWEDEEQQQQQREPREQPAQPPNPQEQHPGFARARRRLGAFLRRRVLQQTADEAGGSNASSGSSSGGSYLAPADEADGPDAMAGAAGCTQFDPNVAAAHAYLGDVDELGGGRSHLAADTTARLPLLMLDGVVLFPGCQLPLLLSSPHELHLLDRCLAAPPPFTRLLAVLPGPRSLLRWLPRVVCCVAEVRQMARPAADGSVAVLALGRQRAEVISQPQTVAQAQSSALVRVLTEGCQTDVPAPLRQLSASIHPVLAKPWDLKLLVGRLRQALQLVLMPLASFQGSPLELSFWVSHNLPLQPATRQLLLTAGSPAERLRLLLGLLQRLDQLSCSACGAALATTADVLAMTAEGIGGTFVNSAGYVHELVAFRAVAGLHLYGQVETAHSWFPGYGWTIAHCSNCGQHLGWRFTAVRPGLAPREFWGLRRPVLMCSSGARQAQQEPPLLGAGGDGLLVLRLDEVQPQGLAGGG